MTTTPGQAELEALKALGAATIYEAQGAIGALPVSIKPIAPGMRVAGPALTVDCAAGDNLVLHHAITVAKPGEVLVVDYKGYLEIAAWGDVMSVGAMARGIAGMVIDGAVRDAVEITAMGFPMFAAGLSIRGPAKAMPGRVRVPITLGGQVVRPGDIVVGDQDGVVVIAAERVGEVLAAARAREAKEAASKAELAKGKTTVELVGLADTIRRLGIG
jgi:4-hydroxy-4-methyl-2-oxoglutarate aldolase